jgi:hypothetical protein
MSIGETLILGVQKPEIFLGKEDGIGIQGRVHFLSPVLAAETAILEVEPAPMPSSTNILTLHRFERITR